MGSTFLDTTAVVCLPADLGAASGSSQPKEPRPVEHKAPTTRKALDRRAEARRMFPRRTASPQDGDDDPYLGTAAICARYSMAPRSWYRNRALFPPPDVTINNRQLWRRSTLDAFDAQQRDKSIARARDAVGELREFIVKRVTLTKTDTAALEKLLATATRIEPAELAAR
jgi:hypothetical protein